MSVRAANLSTVYPEALDYLAGDSRTPYDYADPLPEDELRLQATEAGGYSVTEFEDGLDAALDDGLLDAVGTDDRGETLYALTDASVLPPYLLDRPDVDLGIDPDGADDRDAETGGEDVEDLAPLDDVPPGHSPTTPDVVDTGGAEGGSHARAGGLSPVTSHHSREDVRAVYEALGRREDGTLAGGVADFTRWYNYADVTGGEAERRGRPFALAPDYEVLVDALDRTLYASNTYVSAETHADAWVEARGYGDAREWRHPETGVWSTAQEATPTPDYADVEALVLLVDVDLDDAAKAARHGEGDPDDYPREAVEEALSLTARRFADLAGDSGRVFALDSAGGAYVLLPPGLTAPIGEAFDRDERGVLFDELTDRMNEWVEDVGGEVIDAVPRARETLTFDLVNHKNRLYKAPLAVHKTYDAVVHPLDPRAVDYEALPLDDVTTADVEDARRWAESFSRDTPDVREGVGDLVETLFPDAVEALDGEDVDGERWEAALREFLDDRERRAEQRREAAQEARGRRSTGEGRPDVVTTYGELEAAVDDLDVREVARSTIVAEETDYAAGDAISFAPTWGPDSNGRANIASADAWADTGSGDTGGAAKLALIASEGYDRAHDCRGRAFLRGARLLREEYGFDVPVYVPEMGTTRLSGEAYTQTPTWALCDAAEAFDLCYRSEFERRTSADGEVYESLPDAVYNATLEALDDAGVDHGRVPVSGVEAEASPRMRLDLDERAGDGPTDDPDTFAKEVLLSLNSD